MAAAPCSWLQHFACSAIVTHFPFKDKRCDAISRPITGSLTVFLTTFLKLCIMKFQQGDTSDCVETVVEEVFKSHWIKCTNTTQSYIQNLKSKNFKCEQQNVLHVYVSYSEVKKQTNLGFILHIQTVCQKICQTQNLLISSRGVKIPDVAKVHSLYSSRGTDTCVTKTGKR